MLKSTRPITAILASALLGMALAACGGAASSGDGGTVVTINGQPITKAELDNHLETGASGRQELNQLVQAVLIDQYAKDNSIQVSDDDVQKKEDEIRARYPNGQFEQLLKQQNLTEDDVRRILRQQLELQKAVDKDIVVSNADVIMAFTQNHAQYDKPAQIRAKHILVPDLKTALEVEAKLKAGQKFEDLATQYSTDPGSKTKGGELGFFGKGQMVPQFEAAANSQPIGVAGPPVKSPFGYHIIVVEERKPAVTATLANASTQVRQALMQQKEGQEIPAFLQSLRAKAKFDVVDQRFADMFAPAPPSAVQPPPAAASSPAPSGT